MGGERTSRTSKFWSNSRRYRLGYPFKQTNKLGVIDHYPIELEELKVKLKNTFNQQWANLWDIQKLTCPLGNIEKIRTLGTYPPQIKTH